MDMLRYHKFTIGWGWVVEYGSSDDEEQFGYLYKYSPLHNIKKGTKYPATLITTADHDDRVVPAHSFKFAAEMQYAQGGDAPILIRIDTKAGHGAATRLEAHRRGYRRVLVPVREYGHALQDGRNEIMLFRSHVRNFVENGVSEAAGPDPDAGPEAAHGRTYRADNPYCFIER